MTVTFEISDLRKGDENDVNAFLESCTNALAQHTLGWREVIKSFENEGDRYLIAKRDGQVVGILPAFVYHNKNGNVLQSISYPAGYGGVVSNLKGLERADIFRDMLQELISLAKENDCILATICTSPFSNDLKLYGKYFKPDFIKANFYQYIDLKSGFTTNKERNFRGNIRKGIWQNIKKSDKYTLKIIEDDDLNSFYEWYKIHEKRMEEVNSEPLPKQLFEKSLEYMIKANKGKFVYLKYQDKIVSGIFVIYLKGVIDYFAGSMDREYAYTQANSLLLYKTSNWAKINGFKYYNWQSLPSKESNVYQYKKGWGSLEDTHYYLTKIIDDISEFRKLPLSLIKEEYKWHYVMPYEEFENKA